MLRTCHSPWHTITTTVTVFSTTLSLTCIFKNNASAETTALPESLPGLIVLKSIKSGTNRYLMIDNAGNLSKLAETAIDSRLRAEKTHSKQIIVTRLCSSAHTADSLGKRKKMRVCCLWNFIIHIHLELHAIRLDWVRQEITGRQQREILDQLCLK